MTRTLHPELWWYLARATGITAWVASLGSLLAGLALATRALGARPKGPWLLDLHRGLAGVTLVFTGLHVGALVADSWIHFGVVEVLVPFTSGWRPLAVGAGVIAMWMLVAVEVTSLAMKRLPKALWRAVHLSSHLAAVLATVHALTAGTDAGHPAVVATAVVAVAAATFLLTYRAVGPGRAGARTARAARTA
jgi:sulfoxide reductase heme-binding subunit YedZ